MLIANQTRRIEAVADVEGGRGERTIEVVPSWQMLRETLAYAAWLHAADLLGESAGAYSVDLRRPTSLACRSTA